MILECLPTGMFGSNCYIIGENGEGIIIDPGTDGEDIRKAVEKNGLKIKYIVLTHGHIDHILSAEEVKCKTGAKVLIHEGDASALPNPLYNGSALFGQGRAFGNADRVLKDGDILEAGGLKFEIIHTPGHSPGSICIKVGNSVFTGDTLFHMSIGRTDLGNGSYKDIMDSLKNKLMKLDDNTAVYPGHGESTTIGYERKHNPFLR